MGKKKGNKKGNDDPIWDELGEQAGEASAEPPAPEPPPNAGDEDDFGGLMSTLQKSSKKDKKKNKKKSAVDDEEEQTNAAAEAPPGPSEAQAVTVDDWMNEEFGGSKKEKKSKRKKGGGGGKGGEEDAKPDGTQDEVPPSSEPATAPSKEAPPEEEREGEGEEPTRMLTKAEKEKQKKEKEKAKKKAQAQAKKGIPTTNKPSTTESPPQQPISQDAAPAADDEGAEEGAETGKGKKKKKKKGAAEKKEEPPKEPPKSKGGAKIAALRAAMEEKQKAEEEARRREEEEKRRLEEEERQREEEEKRKEQEKQRKKEKEKAKKEQLKKEGKLLTPKQREERQRNQAKLEALKVSGMLVEGLKSNEPDQKPKKVVYGKRKPNAKKGPNNEKSVPETPPTQEDDANEKEVEAPHEPTPVANGDLQEEKPPTVTRQKSPEAPENEDLPDEWDKQSDEGADWDVSSADESKSKSATSQPAKSQPNPTPTKSPAPKEPPATDKPVPATNGEKEESSSGEDESESESSDESEDESDDSSSEEREMTVAQKLAAKRKAEAAERRNKKHEDAIAARSKDDLRSPICCILGHVDTGKTKLLDKIRQTNVQEGEAGGITQQIGATYFPMENIVKRTSVLEDDTTKYSVPGLLVIDTPGHESFTNLRSRGSSLCNIAVLVVDIMHGLEPQTLESIRLLRDRKTPFIVALNKIDRIYGWDSKPNDGFRQSLARQTKAVKQQFEDRLQQTIVAFAEQGLNAVAYYNNKNFARNVSLVPTSAVTGEGIPDMLMLLIKLTTERMSDRLMYLSELECTVLEVKVIEGLGTTIDVVLSNGVLREGDRIILCGLNGPIATNVRALLTPQPLKELRIKGQYVHHKEVKAALGVKITAPDLEHAIAGSRLMVVGEDDDEDELKEDVMGDLAKLLNSIDKSRNGVCVQASTLGSLEALLEFLKQSKIPVSGINIGPVYKRDIMRCSTMLERAKELAVMLCFDVPVDKEAEKLAEELGVKIFTADIIYHLFDAFKAYNEAIMEAKRIDAAPRAVWPCKLKIIRVFAKRDPIIVGCDVIEGSLRVGTPICVVKIDPTTKKRDIISLGKVTSLEINHKPQQTIKKSQAGAGVAVKIEHASYEGAKMYGRHFDENDELISLISRQSIDVLKTAFRSDVEPADWLLIKKLKALLQIE